MLRQLPQRREEFAKPRDGSLEGQARAALGEEFGAQRQPEVVAATGGRLGGLGLAGDEQGVSAEDGDRGGSDLETRHLAPDDGRQLG